METKEYIIGLKKDINYDQFWSEMENQSNGLPNIPDRMVEIKNERLGSKRLCHYLLTDNEAKKLKEDPRVATVEIPPSQRTDIKLKLQEVQRGDYSRVSGSLTNNQNWGLKRVRSKSNNFEQKDGVWNGGNTYEYILDGSGVDIVVIDSGIERNHPEFLDEDNVSRVQQIDWYVAAGLASLAPNNLATNLKCCIYEAGYITFLEDKRGYFFEWYFRQQIGPSLVLGPGGSFNGHAFPVAYAIYTGSGNNGKSYTIRYEGWFDPLLYQDSYTNHPFDYIWEVTYFDNNTIQILALKHPVPLDGFWFLQGINKIDELTMFKNNSLTQGVPKSIVISTTDNGNNWVISGNESTNYRVVSDGNMGWIIQVGTATEVGSGGLTPVFNPLSPPANKNTIPFKYNTPFNFYTGDTGPQSFYHYRDSDGHGTHVTGIVAGKRFGWAKNSKIYSMKLSELQGNDINEVDSGISIQDGFDLIKLWHQSKPIDPKTGFKRPTIVNMSFGYSLSYGNITGGNYRGTPWVDTVPHPEYGMITNLFNGSHGVRVDSVDIDIQEMIDIGIHICIAAGNNWHKIDVFGGLDYNNYYNSSSSIDPVYYHRGSSPYSSEALIVGCIDSNPYDAIYEKKVSFSNSGPGVDFYAPGTNIISACSRTRVFGGTGPYWYDDSDYNSYWSQLSISGTSMSSPQACGVGALILQLYPNATPQELKLYLINNSSSYLYNSGLNNDYLSYNNIHGGDPKMLYLKFGTSQSFNTNVSSSGISITKK